jgi:arylsulfatase A-like enzyme
MKIVDEAAAEIRHDAERRGTWEQTHLWIVSDHGHSPVTQHDDIAAHLRQLGMRTLAHPWTFGTAHDVAVMVSGNAMAHLYVDLRNRHRSYWPALSDRWREPLDAVMRRPSVDLAVVLTGPSTAEVRSTTLGTATVCDAGGRFTYRPETGDPLGVGEVANVCACGALEATVASDYPDSIVQIARLASSARSGDVILSAARQWDLREQYEPIPHVSSHGALHREHMLVPLVTNRPVARMPRRTVDVMPSALAALGKPIPAGLDGRSFL